MLKSPVLLNRQANERDFSGIIRQLVVSLIPKVSGNWLKLSRWASIFHPQYPGEVRRKTAEILNFWRISVSCCPSRGRIVHVGDQTPLNRGPEYGIIDGVDCRNMNYDVKWQIPY
jgi:hypothetical protein